jgi:hypothetical protein
VEGGRSLYFQHRYAPEGLKLEGTTNPQLMGLSLLH